MRTLLPWICLSFCVIVVLAMPWRRPDPHHDFILNLLHQLEDDSQVTEASGVTAPEAALLEHHTVARNIDGNSGSRV